MFKSNAHKNQQYALVYMSLTLAKSATLLLQILCAVALFRVQDSHPVLLVKANLNFVIHN
jgi:hypothetical protein